MSFSNNDEEPKIPPAKPVDQGDLDAVEKLLTALEEDPDSSTTAKWQRKEKLDQAEREENKTRRRVNRNLNKRDRERNKTEKEYADSLLQFEMELATIKAGEHTARDLVVAAAQESSFSFDMIIAGLHSLVSAPSERKKMSYGEIKDWLQTNVPKKERSSAEPTGDFTTDTEEMLQKYMQFHAQGSQIEQQHIGIKHQIRTFISTLSSGPNPQILHQIAHMVSQDPLMDAAEFERLNFENYVMFDLVPHLQLLEKHAGYEAVGEYLSGLLAIYTVTKLGVIGAMFNYITDEKGQVKAEDIIPRVIKFVSDEGETEKPATKED